MKYSFQNSVDQKKSNTSSAQDFNKGNNSTSQGKNKEIFTMQTPSIGLPKGGGGIKSIDAKFETNSVNGTAALSIPLPTSSARDFALSLTLSYNSGSGNGIFGLGWSLNLPSIKRKVEKQLPLYNDVSDSDTYIISGAEDLVPALKNVGGVWKSVEHKSDDHKFYVKTYRPRIEGAYAKIERWTNIDTNDIFWRVISKDNITSIFGNSASTIIADPKNNKHVFEWLLHYTYDDKGNFILYEYKQEDASQIDPLLHHNRNRVNGNTSFVNTYIKAVKSGNISPYKLNTQIPDDFMFQTVFDYGEHDVVNAPFELNKTWSFREDAFSSYNSGFEIRTARLCKRVLLYHHFKELPGGSALVNSLDFTYSNNNQKGNFSFLMSTIMKGYIKHNDLSYTQKSQPPFEFSYQKHAWGNEVKSISPENLVHAPEGISSAYQWLDLYSEGLNGILTEQNSGWFYKRNLGNGNFSQAQQVSPKPSFQGIGTALQLQELEADGTKYITSYEGVNKGFFKLNDEAEWEPYRSFESMPNINWEDANVRLLDLNGDGKAEVLITEDNVISWFPSLGEKGFDACKNVWQDLDEEKGPGMVFCDRSQSVFLADMTGDGLVDIVRIKNGTVCYWPNHGYGIFGAKVSMDNPPLFDHCDQFNPAFIKLADIDSSGTTDIIYSEFNKVTIWLNQNGNGFLKIPVLIDSIPATTGLTHFAVLDLLGNGTSCFVWNSPEPKDENRSMRYVDLLKAKKPHVLIGYKNNVGKEVELEYTPSTQYYLQDQLEGTPWVTKLPFVVHCLSKIITYDRIMKTRFTTQYSYHHGYYDHKECEFRGFGRVDQQDAEEVTHFVKMSVGSSNNVVSQDLHQPPVITKTWFHTGAYIQRAKILNQFAHEYSVNQNHPENILIEPEFPIEPLTLDEEFEAHRTCKGMLLRKEVYSKDGSMLELTPYSVEQQNVLIKLVQPRGKNRNASFLIHTSESISYHYERNLKDPRIAHNFILEVDNFANVKKSAAVVYKRNPPSPGDDPHFAEQMITYASYYENDFTNGIDLENGYRTPIVYQTKVFELTGLPAPAEKYYSREEIRVACLADNVIDYNVQTNSTLQKRLVDWSRLKLKADDGVTVLAFGKLTSKALIHQTFKAAFNKDHLKTIFSSKISALDLDIVLLDKNKGSYIFEDNYYWVPSATSNYDSLHFYLPVSFLDPYGNTTKVFYDSDYYLFIEKTIDAFNNEVLVKGFNYRVSQPYLLQDANDNLSAVRFDEMGIVTKVFFLGKKSVDQGDAFNFTSTEPTVNEFPSIEIINHHFQWFNQSIKPGFSFTNYKPNPNYTYTRIRETHYNSDSLHQSKFQESYSYFDGSGGEILKKAQAEPGPALQVEADGSLTTVVTTAPNLRWVGTGRTILNNKGNAIKQYEPYFSTSPTYDDEKEMVELGVTSITKYDALGRSIETIFPNKTFNKILFTPWQEYTFDTNDTVRDSEWYIKRGSPDPLLSEPSDSEQRAAWLSAKNHNTPSITYLDTLGRAFCTVDDNISEKIILRKVLDIEDKEIRIIDSLSRIIVENDYDLLGRSLRQNTMDAGKRWVVMDVTDSPVLTWDDRDHSYRFEYDVLHRPTNSFVKIGNQIATVNYEKITYGESLPVAVAKANNLIGVVCKSYDQSGISINESFDFKGNLIQTMKQFVSNYKTIINWNDPSQVSLMTDLFKSHTKFDGMNRPLKLVSPHVMISAANEILPTYNEAGLLNKIEVRKRGSTNADVFVSKITYNAKGQREEIFFGNGTKTRYEYDFESFQLKRMLTTRNTGSEVLQDFHYTFDAVANIVEINNEADLLVKKKIFFDGESVSGINRFEYDAVYRLISASGRKHAGQTEVRPKASQNLSRQYGSHPFMINASFGANDKNAFRNYLEKYTYDKAGNMLAQNHTGKNSNWEREFKYDHGNNKNNRLTSTKIGSDTYNYSYDAHGNMHGLETLMGEVWNFMDQFKEADLGGGGRAYYIYDAGGQRVRKVIERLSGKKEERFYVGNVEVYREHSNEGILCERETLHIMDDQKKVAMIETPIIKKVGNTEVQLIRYQYGNHLGSAAIELDHIAEVISYEEYFPFGTTSFATLDATREVPAKRYRYIDKERDEESGLNYHGARYYALWLCRWTASDPIGVEGGANFYSSVNNSPIIKIDLDGTDVWDYVPTTLKPGGKVFETVDSAFNKNEHPVSAAVLNNLSARGDDLVTGVSSTLKETAEDYADMAYYSVHSDEAGASDKLQAASKRRAEAPLKFAKGAVEGFGGMVKKVGEGLGDIAYYSTAGKDEAGADAKIANAVTDIVLDAPQIILTIVGGANLAKGAVGKIPSVKPTPKVTPKPVPKPVPKAAPKPAPKSTPKPAAAPKATSPTVSTKAQPNVPVAKPKVKRWKVGDPHDAPTAKGQPTWDTVRERYWKNRAKAAAPGEFTSENMKLMKKGNAPIDPHSGLPMELEHIEPQRTGSPTMHKNLLEVTPLEHSFFDRFRHFKDSAGKKFDTSIHTDPRPK